MSYTEIEYSVADRVATITLDRPERLNAFTYVMRGELIDAFDRADADDDVRAVVVTGRGRAFCAGADLERGAGTFDHDAVKDVPGEREVFADGVPRDGAARSPCASRGRSSRSSRRSTARPWASASR